MDKSSGLVREYVTKIRQLSVKHQTGESLEFIKPRIEESVKEAHEHISVWIHGTPEENWKYYIGELGLFGELSSDEKFRTAMFLARDIAKAFKPLVRS